MAVSSIDGPRVLSPAEALLIPSRALPIGSQIAHLVQQFTQLSLQLFTLLSSPPNATSASHHPGGAAAPIYAALAAVDEKLARLLALYDEHRAQQARIDTLVAHLRSLNTTWHTSASTLRACTQALAPVVESGALDRAAIEAARAAGPALAPSNLLAYARLLAPFTSAPPASILPGNDLRGVGATDPTGRTLPPGAIPPFPTEAVMRQGRLQFGREGLLQGLGETSQVGQGHHGSGVDGVHAEAAPGGRPDAATRLEQEAKAHEAYGGAGMGALGSALDATGAEESDEDDDFEFDLDLNPDL